MYKAMCVHTHGSRAPHMAAHMHLCLPQLGALMSPPQPMSFPTCTGGPLLCLLAPNHVKGGRGGEGPWPFGLGEALEP